MEDWFGLQPTGRRFREPTAVAVDGTNGSGGAVGGPAAGVSASSFSMETLMSRCCRAALMASVRVETSSLV